MSYCTYTDVVAEFKALEITATGIMTQTKIEAIIDQSDAFIDGRISLIYVTPITGTKSLLILKQISIGLCAERISNIMKLKSVSPEGSQPLQKDLIKQARMDLTDIVNQDLILVDAQQIKNSGAISSYTGTHTVERTFKKGCRQW